MYLCIANWKARPEWTALPDKQRRELLHRIDYAITELEQQDVEQMSAAIPTAADNEVCVIIWQSSSLEALELLEQHLSATDVDRYFQRVNTVGREVVPQNLSGALLRLGADNTPTEQKGTIGRMFADWMARLRTPRNEDYRDAPPVVPSTTTTTVGNIEPAKSGVSLSTATPYLHGTATSNEIAPYLERIGYSGSTSPTISTLRSLHKTHLMSVPFENLDIMNGRPIVLDREKMYRKIVTEHRGGACFELNATFAWLLGALGFNVTLLGGAVTGRNSESTNPLEHMPLMVKIDGERWHADIGFGDCFVEPLAIDTPGEQECCGEVYKIITDGAIRRLRRQNSEQHWKTQYTFTLLPRRIEEFATMCDDYQVSQESPFTRARICTLLRPDGRMRLYDNSLSITRNGEQLVERILTRTEIDDVLLSEFGLSPQRVSA